MFKYLSQMLKKSSLVVDDFILDISMIDISMIDISMSLINLEVNFWNAN
jgi:hypothetical protein